MGGGCVRGDGRHLSGPLHPVLGANIVPLHHRNGAQRDDSKVRFRKVREGASTPCPWSSRRKRAYAGGSIGNPISLPLFRCVYVHTANDPGNIAQESHRPVPFMKSYTIHSTRDRITTRTLQIYASFKEILDLTSTASFLKKIITKVPSLMKIWCTVVVGHYDTKWCGYASRQGTRHSWLTLFGSVQLEPARVNHFVEAGPSFFQHY